MNRLFRPAMLPWTVFGFFVICFGLHPLSPFFTHRLADPDDYMRLNEVIGWLQGQSWFDLSVPRMSPGGATIIHWSRLIDLPIALVALPFLSFMDVHDAVLLASFVVPLAWFTVLLTLVSALAQTVVGKDRGNLACVLVLFAPLLLFCFTPGRIDHHGVQVIVAGFGLLSLLRLLKDEKATFFALAAAFAFACGFWIGAEILPWAILFVFCLALAAAWTNGPMTRHAAVFGLFFGLFTTAFIPLALPVSDYSSRAVSWFSPAFALFAVLCAGLFGLGWFLGKVIDHKLARISLYALLSYLAASLFFFFVPDALRGVFANYDAFNATTALDNIVEARPMSAAFVFNPYLPSSLIAPTLFFLRLLALPLVALAVALTAAKRAKKEDRSLWLVQSLFLFAGIVLAVFVQGRVAKFMEFFALIPLTYLILCWWDNLRWGLWNRPLFWAEIGVFFLLGPLPVILLPALVNKTPLYPDILLFPAARAEKPCALDPLMPFLNDPQIVGEKPLTFMNISNAGPQILFATRHNVIAGNYDVPGNADAFTFFSAIEDKTALAAARKWNADSVLLCRQAPSLYTGKDYLSLNRTQLMPNKEGMLTLMNTDAAQPLIERLIRGQIPPWLKPIEIFETTDYLLFRIEYPKGRE